MLAACLQDSFLGKINLSNGHFTSLLNYSDISINPPLEIPIKTCSLSNYDVYYFIGYTRIINETHILNLAVELHIENMENSTSTIKNITKYTFDETERYTFSRQISCEPLLYIIPFTPTYNYALVCLFEKKDYIYAETININKYNSLPIQHDSQQFGFKILTKRCTN